MQESLGFAHFFTQLDRVGWFVLAVLVAMSAVSWYLIAFKAWQNHMLRIRTRDFLARFGRIRHVAEAQCLVQAYPPADPYGRVLAAGLSACRQLKAPGERRSFTLASPDDFVSAALDRAIAREGRGLEWGLSALASVGSTAPFVGLFGTVWGIYHALLAIGVTGQASLEQVAGPVGEALIMTAAGLAVAIPAVLAYNAFLRANRYLLGDLESFAHQIFGLLGIGRIDASEPAADPEPQADCAVQGVGAL